jgi:two-component system sensor histidine kinase FlrB
MFSRASEELSGAYSELQGQMARLTGELEAANGALAPAVPGKGGLDRAAEHCCSMRCRPGWSCSTTCRQRGPDQSGGRVEFLGEAQVGDEAGWQFTATTLMPGETPGEFLADPPSGGRCDPAGRVRRAHRAAARHHRGTATERSRPSATSALPPWGRWRHNWPISCARRWQRRCFTRGIWKTPSCLPPAAVRHCAENRGRLKHIERLIQDMLLFARGEAQGQRQVCGQPTCWQNWRRTSSRC